MSGETSRISTTTSEIGVSLAMSVTWPEIEVGGKEAERRTCTFWGPSVTTTRREASL